MPKQLRHTFNTRLMEAGVIQDVRMALMGHSQGRARTTNDLYTHFELPVMREAIQKLEGWCAKQTQQFNKEDEQTPAPAQWLASSLPSVHRGSHRFGTKFVREFALENLGWKVASLLSAQRTLRGNPGIRHGAYRGGDALTALLAADREVAVPSL
jgi:hypothetical protein